MKPLYEGRIACCNTSFITAALESEINSTQLSIIPQNFIKLWNFSGLDSKHPSELSNLQSKDYIVAEYGGQHSGRITWHEWNGLVAALLASSDKDGKLILWDATRQSKLTTMQHCGYIHHFGWSINGQFLATSCNDRNIRIFDPRISRHEQFCLRIPAHFEIKPSKIMFLSETHILNIIQGVNGLRKWFIWDLRDAKAPTQSGFIDQSSAVFQENYDADLGLLFLASREESSIRFYEFTKGTLQYLDQFRSSHTQSTVCWMPKRGLDVSRNEIARCFRFHRPGSDSSIKNAPSDCTAFVMRPINRSFIEPVHIRVPNLQSPDASLYPLTNSDIPLANVNEWQNNGMPASAKWPMKFDLLSCKYMQPKLSGQGRIEWLPITEKEKLRRIFEVRSLRMAWAKRQAVNKDTNSFSVKSTPGKAAVQTRLRKSFSLKRTTSCFSAPEESNHACSSGVFKRTPVQELHCPSLSRSRWRRAQLHQPEPIMDRPSGFQVEVRISDSENTSEDSEETRLHRRVMHATGKICRSNRLRASDQRMRKVLSHSPIPTDRRKFQTILAAFQNGDVSNSERSKEAEDSHSSSNYNNYNMILIYENLTVNSCVGPGSNEFQLPPPMSKLRSTRLLEQLSRKTTTLMKNLTADEILNDSFADKNEDNFYFRLNHRQHESKDHQHNADVATLALSFDRYSPPGYDNDVSSSEFEQRLDVRIVGT
ncbi:coronin, actin binding protein, 1A [Cichlidogyrus casuarinus]|uniref:Coronin, actin binding protein, 1A n=1 Tax=Cichlidogyrus casuarinus TaxID=1844966 RepID=A0ABD2QFH4_9PLAT